MVGSDLILCLGNAIMKLTISSPLIYYIRLLNYHLTKITSDLNATLSYYSRLAMMILHGSPSVHVSFF